MTTPSKWVSGAGPDAVPAEAANKVLKQRFAAVSAYLPDAGSPAGGNAEAVHQLRVATRRANAAVRIFEPCLPAKAARRLRRALRDLRQVAGTARDADVLRDFLEASEPPRDAERVRLFLAGYLAAERGIAQRALSAHVADCRATLEGGLRDCLDHPAPPSGTNRHLRTLTDLADGVIRSRVFELEQAAVQLPADPERLHQVRILGKRLRYSMEVFAGCYAGPFREQLYPAVEAMQELLGEVNDLSNAAARLTAIADEAERFAPTADSEVRDALREWGRRFAERIGDRRAAFREWWGEWRQLRQTFPLEGMLLRGPSSASVGA